MIIRIFDVTQTKMAAVRTVTNSVKELIEAIEDKEITLDFSEIESISGAVAQSFLRLKEDFEKKSIQIEFINLNERLVKLFTKVQASRYSTKPSRPDLAPTLYPIEKIDELVVF